MLIKAIPNSEKYNYNNSIDVSSRGKKPFKFFSPFSYNSQYKIPIPGLKDVTSNSVEGIWQGLKIINGTIDESYFVGKPKKRPKGDYYGHSYKGKIIDIVKARKEIYQPSYSYFLSNCVPKSTFEEIFLTLIANKELFIYDTENSINPKNSSMPLAHSFYLAEYLNENFNQRLDTCSSNIKKLYLNKEFQSETIAEPIIRVSEYFKNTSRLEKKLILINIDKKIKKEKERFKYRFYKELQFYLNS